MCTLFNDDRNVYSSINVLQTNQHKHMMKIVADTSAPFPSPPTQDPFKASSSYQLKQKMMQLTSFWALACRQTAALSQTAADYFPCSHM